MSRRSSTPLNEVILGEKTGHTLKTEHVRSEGVMGVLRVGAHVVNLLVTHGLDLKPLNQELSV